MQFYDSNGHFYLNALHHALRMHSTHTHTICAVKFIDKLYFYNSNTYVRFDDALKTNLLQFVCIRQACAPRYVFHTMSPHKIDRVEPVGTCYVMKNGFETFTEYSPCRTSKYINFNIIVFFVYNNFLQKVVKVLVSLRL